MLLLLLVLAALLLLGLVPVAALLDTVGVLAASLGGDLGDGLLKQVRILLLDNLPPRVLHDVGVVFVAVRKRSFLEVSAAVGVGEEEDLGHVERVDDLTQVGLALHLQAGQLAEEGVRQNLSIEELAGEE